MAEKNTSRRQQRRRRRKIKASFRIYLAVFIALMCIGTYTGYIIYRNNVLNNMYGDIRSREFQEDDSFTVTKGAVQYTVFDIGDGEAILIKCGSTEALIDTGTEEGSKKLCNELEKRISGSLEYLVLTGSSERRIGGAERLLSEFSVDTCIVGEMGDAAQKISYLINGAGKRVDGEDLSYDMGDDATLFIIKPEVSSDDEGDRSLVTYFTFGKTGFVSLSDAGEEEIARAFGSVDSCNVIVLARHGNKVNLALPGSSYNYCVSTAEKQSGMPADEVEAAIHARFYTTGETGTLEFISDGASVSLSNEEAVKAAMDKQKAASDNEAAGKSER